MPDRHKYPVKSKVLFRMNNPREISMIFRNPNRSWVMSTHTTIEM